MNYLPSDRETLQLEIHYIALISILRKPVEYMAGLDLNDPKVIAQILIDFIPKESQSSIKEQAEYALKIKDPCECLEFDENKNVKENKGSRAREGLLKYADCMEFR